MGTCKMPIPVMFDWGETDVSIWFTLRIPGSNISNTDVLVTRNFIRVNKAPHLFEADLYDEIDFRHAKNIIRFECGQLFIAAMKSENAQYLWKTFKLVAGQKHGPVSNLKPAFTATQLRERRQVSEKEYKEWQTEKAIRAKALKFELNRTAQDELWSAEGEKREKLAHEKASEKAEATKSIDELIAEERDSSSKPALESQSSQNEEEKKKTAAAAAVASPLITDKYAYRADEDMSYERDSDDEEAPLSAEEVKEEKLRRRQEELQIKKETETRREAERQERKLKEERERKELEERMRAGGAVCEFAPMNAKRKERVEKKLQNPLPPVRDMADVHSNEKDFVLANLKDLSITADPNSILTPPSSSSDASTVKQGATIKVQMTKKIFPNVPLREQHLTLMQQPKPRKVVNPANSGDAGTDEEDPLWLKDRADQLARLGDFDAAIDAYSTCLASPLASRFDENWFARVLCCRAECFVRVKKLEESEKDLSMALYKLYIAAQQRNADCDSNKAANVSAAATVTSTRPVMDLVQHRLWSNIRARQAHVAILLDKFAEAEKNLVSALEVEDAIAEDVKQSLKATLQKVRDTIRDGKGNLTASKPAIAHEETKKTQEGASLIALSSDTRKYDESVMKVSEIF
eukprot:GDKK01040843.1.p1 GENE.GDKK01040843.1~~GDKK01040843.1.p1  ORF type:complete len:635 (-),score=175.27 GDKK01040843.1:77-1981(-)